MRVSVPEFNSEDARLYGILLGDGHLSKEGMQWGVSGNPRNDEHLQFVRDYLKARGYALLDVQWTNAHTRSLGATDISRTEYVARLARAIEKKVVFF